MKLDHFRKHSICNWKSLEEECNKHYQNCFSRIIFVKDKRNKRQKSSLIKSFSGFFNRSKEKLINFFTSTKPINKLTKYKIKKTTKINFIESKIFIL